MMATLRAASLGAIAVFGQVPDLREGDCVQALDNIDYEHMPGVKRKDRGMVTGKGILWEKRNWLFTNSSSSGSYLFAQRNAIIHRSMVEKTSETEGYGVIKQGEKCLTVFELDALNDGKRPQSAKIQLWDCVPGWTDQMFIYPACGLGPGQIRWVKDPQMCAYRQVQNQKLVLAACEWTQPFIFEGEQDSPGTQVDRLRVGLSEYDPRNAINAAGTVSEQEQQRQDYNDGKRQLPNGEKGFHKDAASKCFGVSGDRVTMKTPATVGATQTKENFGESTVDTPCLPFELPGLWKGLDTTV